MIKLPILVFGTHAGPDFSELIRSDFTPKIVKKIRILDPNSGKIQTDPVRHQILLNTTKFHLMALDIMPFEL